MVAPIESSSTVAGAAPAGKTVVAVLLGVVSVLTMPLAVFATRYSETYDLEHAGFAIPIGLVAGVLAVRLAGPGRGAVPLAGRARSRTALVLGWAGIWLAGASLVAIGFWALLSYLGNRS